MATKETIVNLVNKMILLTKENKINWTSRSANEVNIPIPENKEFNGLVYFCVLNNENFRLYRINEKKEESVFAGLINNYKPKPSPIFKLEIFDRYKKNVRFEFPNINQIGDLYILASKQVFDIDDFTQNINLDGE